MRVNQVNIPQFTAILFYMYLIQGVPYGIQAKFLPIFLRKNGYSLTQVSVIKFLYLPLLFKTLYAPIIELYLTKKTWMQISIALLTMNSFVMIFIHDFNIYHLSMGIFIMNFLCSIQDVALDSLALSILHSPQDIVNNNVAQVVGYKIGSLLGGGILLTLSTFVRWQHLFLVITFLYAIGFLLTVTCSSIKNLPRERSPEGSEESFIRTSAAGVELTTTNQLSNQRKVNKMKLSIRGMIVQSVSSYPTLYTVVFLIIYKLGEQGASNMLPLYLLDLNVPVGYVGFWTGVVGQIVSILGSAYSGHFVRNFPSTIKAIEYLSLIVAPLITLLTLVIGPTFIDQQNVMVFSVVVINLLYLVSGMMTTATFTLIMQCSHTRPVHLQNTNYTVLSTLEVFGKLIFTSSIGVYTDRYGYFYSYILFSILSWMTCLYISIFKAQFGFSDFQDSTNSLFSGYTELIELN